ncbi:MAG: ACP S-malonyltransferase [Acholeplasmataceae bacterium]
MSKLAVVFTGQGSQYTMMGYEDLSNHEAYQPLLEAFEASLGYDPLNILKNTENELDQTIYAQPMIVLLSLYLFDTIEATGVDIKGFLGFSLGEISALYASKAINLNDIIRLIKHRALWMDEAAHKSNGGMAAVIGLDVENILLACQRVSDDASFVMPVNYNSLEQTVISGSQEKIQTIMPELKALGAKRVIPLSVSGAFHTPYMAYAHHKLEGFLESITLHETTAPIYLNVTAKPHQLETLKQNIALQVVSPVFFYQSMIEMKKDGFTHFLEIGPKPVLTSLIKKIDQSFHTMSLTSLKEVDAVKGWLETHGFKK